MNPLKLSPSDTPTIHHAHYNNNWSNFQHTTNMKNYYRFLIKSHHANVLLTNNKKRNNNKNR